MTAQLCIQPVSPLPGQVVTLEDENRLHLSVQVTLGCGMPTCAGGRWDPKRMRMTAMLFSGGQLAGSADLSFTGRVSEFSGILEQCRPGDYSMTVDAQDLDTGAAGRLSLSFRVKAA